MNENRTSVRRRVLKAGTIEFGGGAIDCKVRNLSETGAALEVESPIGIPQQFRLVIASDSFSRPCEVVWLKEHRVGIIFL